MTTRMYAYDLAFADATARLAYVPQPGDLDKVARQADDGSYWRLRNVSPAEWSRVGENAPGPGGWRPMKVIFDAAAVLPATPNVVLIDEVVDLLPWGLVATTYRNADFCTIIEKPDGNGGWVVTNAPEAGFYDPETGQVVLAPGLPPADVRGYRVNAEVIPSPMPLPKLPEAPPPAVEAYFDIGNDPGRDWDAAAGARPGLPYSPQPENRITRARVRVRRDSTEYTPEQQAEFDALGYRIRVKIEVTDLVAWEKEVPIPEADGSFLVNERIYLSDYGLISDHDRFVFVADVLRDGKPILSYIQNEYVPGEAFGPPTHPVMWAARPVFPGTPWWNGQNSDQGGRKIDRGSQLGAKLAFCSESVRDAVQVLAWRHGPLAATYRDGTLSQAVIDLSSIPGAGASTLFARSGVPETVMARFVPDPSVLSADGAIAEPTVDGVRIRYMPGTTLAKVFAALDLATNPSNPLTTVPTSKLVPGILDEPGCVISATAPFELSVDVPAAPEVPVPPGAGADCTFRVRLLVAPPNRVWEYPFGRSDFQNDTGVASVVLRRIQSEVPVSEVLSGLPSPAMPIWNHDGQLMFTDKPVALRDDLQIPSYTTDSRPLPDASWHRKTISVKNPGVDEVFYICRQLADNSYAWVAIPIG